MWKHLTFLYLALSATAKKDEWAYFEKTGFQYKLFTQPSKFSEAERLCQNYGAQIASIHSKEENDFIYKLSAFQKKPGKGEQGREFMWIGLKKVGSKWTWIDKTPLDFTAWAEYQPDDWMKSEKCGQLYNWMPTNELHNPDWYLKRWNDIPCNTVVKSTMCKRKQKR